jgi:hypothetical protein
MGVYRRTGEEDLMMSDKRSSADTAKREFLKKATYAVPAVLTLAVAPSFASAGSSSGKSKKANNGGYKTKGSRKSGDGRRWGGEHDD